MSLHDHACGRYDCEGRIPEERCRMYTLSVRLHYYREVKNFSSRHLLYPKPQEEKEGKLDPSSPQGK